MRRRLPLIAGAVLFIAGAASMSIGLVGYLNDSASPALEPAESQSIADFRPFSIDDVENLPVATPYSNPQIDPEITEAQPEPEPERVREVTAPFRLIIDGIDVNAPVITMGLEDGGIPEVPLNGQDVAWYDFSSLPGAGSNAVFAGHINWGGAPGVFANLSKMQAGNTISLRLQDGRDYTYEVFANFPVDPFDPESLKVMAPTPTDTITLITCGGSWLPDPSERFGGNYSNRTIVQARLMQPSLMAPVPSAISSG